MSIESTTQLEARLDLLQGQVMELQALIVALQNRVAALEASQPAKVLFNAPWNEQEECEQHQCSYFQHYLAYGGPDLAHEGFHAAERIAKSHHDTCRKWDSGHECQICLSHEDRLRA